MNGTQNYLEIIEKYIVAYNKFEIDEMLQNFTDDIYFENIYNGQVNLQIRGITDFKTQAETAKKLFQQREQTILDIKFNGNTAEVKINFAGILSNSPENGPQAGAALNMIGYSVFVFKKGRISSITDRS